ncbi:MAG TPA: 23S rRNA (guanosine(2251)-2'-O)-methyltransferase RlmB [Bacillota bacterium]|nr:23S rRNA (guanosine(2251)-2'-O)-methyltransferase RlmB [Bacillota bacterium]
MADKRIIEGRNPVREALLGHCQIDEIIISAGPSSPGLRDIVRLAQDRHIRVKRVTQEEMARLSRSRSHQGVIAVCPPYEYGDFTRLLESVRQSSRPALLVVLDGIEDPGNLGSIIRTSECAGADGVVVRERRAVGVTPAVEKAAAGATQHLPVCRVSNIRNALEQAKDAGIWVVGATGDSSRAYYEADLTVPLALVIGSEGKGLSRLVRETCDYTVSVPMFGKISSLNAAVAAAIMMYEVVRQRLCR